MDFLQAIGGLLSFAAFGLIAALVLKAFQITSDLGEIKDLLRDIRRNGEDLSPASYRAAIGKKQEGLLRELDDTSYASAVQAAAGVPPSPEPLAQAIRSESEPPVLQAEVVSQPSGELK